jgi:hypothetical protein
MAGTVMTLHRYGGRNTDYRTQEILFTKDYLTSIPDPLLITLDYYNEPGSRLLDVYYNGQLLLPGGGYEEVDNYTIRLNLGIDENGNPILPDENFDELYIKSWENHYYNRGPSNVSSEAIDIMLRKINEIISYGGAANVDIDYEYNDRGFISKETITGEHYLIRELEYNTIDEISQEKIYYQGRTVTKSYNYDLNTGRLLKSSVSVSQ